MYFEKRWSVKYFGIRKRVKSDKYLEMEVGSHKKKTAKGSGTLEVRSDRASF